MISLPDELLKQIDALAKIEHRKRSEFFKELAVQYLRQNPLHKREFQDLEAAAHSSFDFWDNPIDNELWNETTPT